jgi:hypothetical protein
MDSLHLAATNALVAAQRQYYRLVLIVGENAEANTQLLNSLAAQSHAVPINLTLEFGRALQSSDDSPATVLQRLFQAEGELTTPLFLDAIDILFAKKTNIDPYTWLRQSARNRLVCATWLGTYAYNQLSYAPMFHDEHRTERNIDVIVIDNQSR